MSVARTKVNWRQPAPDTAPPTTTAKPAPPPASAQPASPPAADDDFFPVTTGGRSPDVAPGSYRLTLHDLLKQTGPNRFAPERGDQTQYLWYFRLSDDPDATEGTFIWYSGTNFRSKKLVAVLAALGVPASGFHKSTVLGRECLGQVDLNDRGYAKLINVVGIPK